MATDWLIGSDIPPARLPRRALGRYTLEQGESRTTCLYSFVDRDVVVVGDDNSFLKSRENEMAWRHPGDGEVHNWEDFVDEEYPFSEALCLATAAEAASTFDLGDPEVTTSAYNEPLGLDTEINTYSDGSIIENDATTGHVVRMDVPSFRLRFSQFWAE